MKMSRRKFLTGTALALIASSAEARFPRGTFPTSVSGHNGGKSQTNLDGLVASGGGGPMFINMVKGWPQIQYQGTPTDPNVPQQFPIIELDTNGYPTTQVAGTSGYEIGGDCTIPGELTYSGDWVLKWDGTGTVTYGNVSNWSVFSSSANRIVYRPSGSRLFISGVLSVSSFSNSPNHVRNIRMCRAVDETLMDAGELLYPPFKTAMQYAKPGCIRNLDIHALNAGNACQWANRLPVGNITYIGTHNMPSLYAGKTTRSGMDYTITTFSGFTRANKSVVSVLIDSDCPTWSDEGCTISTASPCVVTRTGHGLTVGNAVVLGGSGLPTNGATGVALVQGQIYYVQSVPTADTFTIAATRGGAAINTTVNGGGGYRFSAIASFSINGTAFTPAAHNAIIPNVINAETFSGFGDWFPKAGRTLTMTYDGMVGWYLGYNNVNQGVLSGMPPEVFIEICAQLKAHPWICAPYLDIDTMTTDSDWTRSYMALIKSRQDSDCPWMKPVVEPCNETWNFGAGFWATRYAQLVGAARLNLSNAGNNDIDNAYGKWVSDLGQLASSVWSNNRNKYSVICGFQSAGFTYQPTNPRITGAVYVANGGSPPKLWCDRLCLATYFAPTMRFTVNDLKYGFNWTVTYNGDQTNKDILANAYVATCHGLSTEAFSLEMLASACNNMKLTAQAQTGSTIKGIVAYEGGYSPDYIDNNWSTTYSAASKASSCVLTVPNTVNSPEAGTLSGNPFVVGMPLRITGEAGMTSLNNKANFDATFTAGSADISGSNTLVVGDAVVFDTVDIFETPGTNNLVPGLPYYCVQSGNPFRLSATKGGSAITWTANIGRNAKPVYIVTVVNSTTSITIDLNSSGFSGTASGAGIDLSASKLYSNNIRKAGKSCTTLGTMNTDMYGVFDASAEPGFVMEWPSNFIYWGTGNVWSVLDPSLAAPSTPQWESIHTYNL